MECATLGLISRFARFVFGSTHFRPSLAHCDLVFSFSVYLSFLFFIHRITVQETHPRSIHWDRTCSPRYHLISSSPTQSLMFTHKSQPPPHPFQPPQIMRPQSMLLLNHSLQSSFRLYLDLDQHCIPSYPSLQLPPAAARLRRKPLWLIPSVHQVIS